MRTTLEIPDARLRRAQAVAVARGIALQELVSEALTEKLSIWPREAKPWMKSFGKLRCLHQETARIDAIINAEFGRIEAPDC